MNCFYLICSAVGVTPRRDYRKECEEYAGNSNTQHPLNTPSSQADMITVRYGYEVRFEKPYTCRGHRSGRCKKSNCLVDHHRGRLTGPNRTGVHYYGYSEKEVAKSMLNSMMAVQEP